MKASSGLYLFILILWMGGSTYWYLCKIKNHCHEISTELSNDVSNDLAVKQDNLKTSNTDEKTKQEILNNIEDKIINGFVIYNFPENSIKNDNIEESFDEFAGNLKLYLEEHTADKIEIVGHTDDVGTIIANAEFGMKRALFIKKKLLKKGISEDQMILSSKGKKEPVTSNETKEGRTQNRRVVIILIKN